MLDITHWPIWIGGTSSKTDDLIPIENPATGEIFAQCCSACDADVNEAVRLAHETFKAGTWSRAERGHRADVLDEIAKVLSAHLPELIDLEVRQTGRAIRELRAQVPSLTRWFKYYAAILRTEERAVLPTTGKLHNWIDRRPLGVVVQITPFNHPLLIAVKKLAPALAAGNSVILKPSELTPLTSIVLGELLKKAGLPDGVFSVLPGYGATTGKALVSHRLVKKVDVTGGTPAGRIIGSIAGQNLARFTGELGGKAPVIVTGRANVDLAVNGVAFGAFIASGQTCVAATRIIVDRTIFDRFLQKLQDKVVSVEARMGSPSNPNSMMGPLISLKQLEKVEQMVAEAVASGMTVITGGKRLINRSALDDFDLSKGHFYAPTILSRRSVTVPIESFKIWQEEVFGPVVIVESYDGSNEHALRLANDSEFGLGAAIWTSDIAEAHALSAGIEAGICWVNTHHRNDPSSPWGGIGDSGVGSENGIDAYHAYTTTKSTIINYASDAESLSNDDWFRDGDQDIRYG